MLWSEMRQECPLLETLTLRLDSLHSFGTNSQAATHALMRTTAGKISLSISQPHLSMMPAICLAPQSASSLSTLPISWSMREISTRSTTSYSGCSPQNPRIALQSNRCSTWSPSDGSPLTAVLVPQSSRATGVLRRMTRTTTTVTR